MTIEQAIAQEDLKPPFEHHYLTDQQVEHVKVFRIPVDSSHPMTYWIASIHRESAMPTDEELRMIRSFIEYEVQNRYNLTYQEKIFAKPFPAEGGHVTKVFRKGSMWTNQPNACEGWVYRRASWEGGWHPQWPAPRLSLLEVLDDIWAIGWGDEPRRPSSSWVEWKAARPDIFPVSL
jgi:hypothetical protein